MATDRPTDDLVERMLSAAAGVADARVERLITDAAAEAEAEVRAMLKSAMKAALLRRAAARLEAADLDAGPEGSTSKNESPPGQKSEAATVADPAPTSGWYIYGITGAAAAPLPEDLPGVDDAFPLELISHKNLTAIASRVSVDAFGRAAPGDNGRDLEWVGEKVLAHDRVVKAALAGGPVIPLRFGAVVRSEADVRQILSEHNDRLLDALDALDGRKEWGVKIAAREEILARQVAVTSDRVREVGRGDERETDHAAPGRAYFKRKKRGEVVREEAGRTLREAVADCHRQLSDLASNSAALPVRAPAAGEAESAGAARVVWNGAYLVADDAADRFHALAADLAERYRPQGLDLEVAGPWPPYNFVALDLTVGAAS
jgi:hypothetical protein